MLRVPAVGTTFIGLPCVYPQDGQVNRLNKTELYPVVENYVEEIYRGMTPSRLELEGVW